MAFLLIAGTRRSISSIRWIGASGRTGPEELLPAYDDLLRFTEQSKLLARDKRAPRRRLADEKRCWVREALREALAHVFYGLGSPSASRRTLERYFKEARAASKACIGSNRRVWNGGGPSADATLRFPYGRSR